MPECPDVEIFKQYLDATSLHQKIEKVAVNDGRILKDTSSNKLKRELKGHYFGSTVRHGKHLFVETDNQYRLELHFGMTGFLRYYKNENEKGAYDKVVFAFDNNYKLAYVCTRMLGQVSLIKSIDEFLKNNELGPDALSLDIDDFRQIFESGRGSVKSTLMNQKFIAGLGNIYSDEILFQARIRPDTKCSSLTDADVKKIHKNMKKVIDRAVERRADPEKLPRSYLLVHRQEGENCPRCHNEIQLKKISGRTAFFCPNCQK